MVDLLTEEYDVAGIGLDDDAGHFGRAEPKELPGCLPGLLVEREQLVVERWLVRPGYQAKRAAVSPELFQVEVEAVGVGIRLTGSVRMPVVYSLVVHALVVQAASRSVPDESRSQQGLNRRPDAVVHQHVRKHFALLHDVENALVLACRRASSSLLPEQPVRFHGGSRHLFGRELLPQVNESKEIEAGLLLW